MWKTIIVTLTLPPLIMIAIVAQASPLSIFEGSWKGHCRNLVPDPVRPERTVFEMERRIFAIAGTNRWLWNSSYHMDGGPDGTKDYQMVTVDEAHGHYQLDEGGNVPIDTFLAANTLYSEFQVANVRIVAIERVQGNTLTLELFSFGTTPLKEGIPVLSFSFLNNQQCQLQKF